MKMTKTAVIVLAVVTFLLIPLLGCGPVSTKTYDYTDFTRVEVSSGFHVELVQSDSYSVSVTASEALFNFIQVSKEADTLIIGLTGFGQGTKKAEITMPTLTDLTLNGGSHATITGFSSTETLDINLSGGSHLDGDIESGDTSIKLSSGSHITLSGSGADTSYSISGGSHAKLGDFNVENAELTASGGSHATINVSGILDVIVNGGSHVSYKGDPSLGNVDVSGGSTFKEE
jgi:hypothetical protein